MSFLSRIRETIDNYKNKKVRIQALKEAENIFYDADTTEEGIEKASEAIKEAIKSNPDIAIKLLKLLQESNLERNVRLKIAEEEKIKQLSHIVKEAVKEGNLSSKEIKGIVRQVGENISPDATKEIIQQIPNPKIREEEQKLFREKLQEVREQERRDKEEKRIKEENEKKKKLKQLYENVERKPISVFTNDINSIKGNSTSPEIQQIVRRVLARRAAIDYKRTGSTFINTLTSVLPAEDMMKRYPTRLSKEEKIVEKKDDLNFIELVEVEYNNIKGITGLGGKEYIFDKKNLEKIILKEIAKDVVNIFHETGIIDVPQSATMRELDDEQVQYFINQIQIYGSDIKNIQKIKDQISGIQNREDEDWLNIIRKIPEDKKEEVLQELMQKYIKVKNEEGTKKSDLETRVNEVGKKILELNEDDANQILKAIEEEVGITQREVEYTEYTEYTK